jgi:hypothetical protein
MNLSKATRILLVVVLWSSAPAFTLAASADGARRTAGHAETSIEFRYHDWQSGKENYQRLNRTVTKACTTEGMKLMVTRVAEAACIDGMIDLAVERLDRADLATAHHQATGRVVGSSNQVASSGR